jgi:hypothetical protein
MEMFEILLKVVPLSADAFKWLLSQQAKKREEFAFLCERISQNLESFAKASDDERQSRNLCHELRVYVPEIEKMANGILEDNQLKAMAQALNTVCKAWEEHREKQEKNSHIDARDLLEVEDAAGHFRGLANIVHPKS